MHTYESSEALVQELESAVQQETNESRKTQYQTILQTQKNISANLKSLGDANATPQELQAQQQQQAQQAQTQTQRNQAQQGTQAYNTEFAKEQNLNTNQYTSEAQAQARQEAQRKARQNTNPDSENKA